MADLATFQMPWITVTLLMPLVGALLLALVPGEHKQAHRHLTTLFMGLTFLVSLPILAGFDATETGYQLTTSLENIEWIGALGANYHVGIDGVTIWLVMMTTFLGPLIALSGYKYIDKNVKEYHVSLLVLQSAMIGAFVSLDILLFYVFWELMLVPMYLLIGVWGGKDRLYASVKLFLYTMAGSVLMLIAILYIYAKGGGASFDLGYMTEVARGLSFSEQQLLMAAFAVAFLIKVPAFPFHTWLPDAHVQAPTAGSVILASVLLKMGTYGLLRYGISMFPDAAIFYAPYISVLAVIGVVYGALAAFVQTDIKKLVAYSSVSHMGFIILGLFAMTEASVTGALFQNLAHGVTTGGLFLGLGILYERRHTREMAEFGGIAKSMPVFATFYLVFVFGSAAVPGTVGFVGEFLIMKGAAESFFLNFGGPVYFGDMTFGPDMQALTFVGLAGTGVILGALYLLWLYRKVFFGPTDNPANQEVEDISGREISYLLPLVLLTVFMGFQPEIFINKMEATVADNLSAVQDAAQTFAGDVEADAQRAADLDAWMRTEGAGEGSWSLQAEHGYAGHGDSHGDDHGDSHGDDHGDDHGH